jgi:glycosyltransferase involved in cell wall biosynthesis
MTSGPTVLLVPVLRRPRNVGPLVRSVAENTPEPHRLLFIATAGDWDEIAAIEEAGAEYLTVPPTPRGDYARKINAGYAATSEPFLFLGADDLRFHPGWLSAGLALFADDRIGVVGTQDLAPTERARTGQHATHSLVRRTYVDECGTIDRRGLVLHPGYWHEYVDDELIATARARGAFAFAEHSVVEHLHPSWGKAPTDELYQQQRRRMSHGRALFARRRRLWTSR